MRTVRPAASCCMLSTAVGRMCPGWAGCAKLSPAAQAQVGAVRLHQPITEVPYGAPITPRRGCWCLASLVLVLAWVAARRLRANGAAWLARLQGCKGAAGSRCWLLLVPPVAGWPAPSSHAQPLGRDSSRQKRSSTGRHCICPLQTADSPPFSHTNHNPSRCRSVRPALGGSVAAATPATLHVPSY